MSFHVSTQFWLCSSIFRVYLQSPEGRFGWSSPSPWSCHGPGRPSAGSCSSQSSLSCWAFQRKVYKSYMYLHVVSVFGIWNELTSCDGYQGISWFRVSWCFHLCFWSFGFRLIVLRYDGNGFQADPSPSAQLVRTTLQAFRSPHEQWPLKTLGNAVAKEGQGVESKLEMAGDFCKTVAHGCTWGI